MNAVERFAQAAQAFRAWACQESDTGEFAARNALFHVTQLYCLAIQLPPIWNKELENSPDAESVDRWPNTGDVT